MEKKESRKDISSQEDIAVSPKKEGRSTASRMSPFYNRVFGIIKFILGVCLLPFVYSFTVSFCRQFGLLETWLQNYFWRGVVVFLIVYLFIWEPVIIYSKGQKLMELTFSFIKPLVRVAPYLFPIYALLLFLSYLILSLFIKSADLAGYFIFFLGFSIAMHLVFSAKTVRSKQEDFLKANYIFGSSFIYITSLCLVAVFLNSIFTSFSLIEFITSAYRIAVDIVYAVFKQLFLR